jgi:putative transposase
MPEELLNESLKIVSTLLINAKTGRPRLAIERALNGIYYILKTGVQWNALPHCFGSSAAVHRLFQELVNANFFEQLWSEILRAYEAKNGLQLKQQAMDCSYRKSPLGCEKSGKSPVDRGKLGTKISVISDSKGVIIGLAVGSGNQHDSTLFLETLSSIPKFLKQPQYKEMHLDSAYDDELTRTILFNSYYIPKIAPNKRNSKIERYNPLGYSRWFIEPVHAWMNKFRSIFVRYYKSAKNYLAQAQFAAATIIFNRIGV